MLQVYTDNIPNLQRQFSLQGMIYNEIVEVQCTIQHFAEASRYDWKTENPTAYDSIVPKIGDLMYFKYSDLYYEVLNVKDFAEGTTFLSTPITYKFSLRVWRNSHENVDELNVNDDNMEHLRSYVELGETFNVEHDMGENNKHISVEEHPDYSPKETSKVKASGDILNINDTTNWQTLRNSDNADAMDVLYDPNKKFEPFEQVQKDINELNNDYIDSMNDMGNRADEMTNELDELNNEINRIKKSADDHIETLNKEAKDISDDIFDIGFNSDYVEYHPKKR